MGIEVGQRKSRGKRKIGLVRNDKRIIHLLFTWYYVALEKVLNKNERTTLVGLAQ